MMEKKSLHTQTSRNLTPMAFEEGFKIISFMPILEKDEVMGGLVMASKVLEKIPDQVRIGLEFLAAQSGNSIARMQARGLLEAEITVRKEAEKTLSMKSRNLEEVNTALKVLLEQREQDKNELEDKILFNVRKLILPYIDSLKQRRLDYEQTTYLDVLETNLKNIISPFAKKLTSIHEKFTPQEIKVADLIRDGKTVKEISLAFGVSESAINVHRQHIRNKLGLNNQKINLRTYLLSLA
jgi:ATP/maltotriose-dependent transcriptional regulator MalT